MVKLRTINILGLPNGILHLKEWYDKTQGRSQNLKEVPQNFMEYFIVDDVTANGVIQKNQHP